MTQPEVASRLEKLERTMELKGLHQPQANPSSQDDLQALSM